MKYVLAIITLTLMAFMLSLNVPAQNDPQAEFVDGVVLVKFKPGAAKNKKKDAVNSVSGNTEKEYTIVPGLQKISTNLDVQKAIDILSKNPNVEYAEPDFIVNLVHADQQFPNEPDFGSLWAMNNGNDVDLDGPEAWYHYTGDPDFIIANIDTGVDIDHEDLVGNIWVNPGETLNGIDDDSNGYIDDINGWDFVNNDNDPADGYGHGTHTAGTSCARGDNNTGVTGVIWNCKIMALKFLSDGGSGFTSDAVEAVQYAASFGVKVSNNSWGGPGFSTSLYNAINNAGQTAGHIFVAAAGNANTNIDGSPFYPASYNLDNLISVASITSTGSRSSFSNHGATSVDLGAGGSSIRSTLPGDIYASWSGTSMATPHVTGVVALVSGYNSGLSYNDVINRIYSNVKPSTSMDGITVTGGIVDAHCAVIDCDGGGGGGPSPYCGDGNCDPNESTCSCQEDCGLPTETELLLCTDGEDNDCDGSIDCSDSDCSSDPSCACDNDGTCETGEDCGNCPNDCIFGTGLSCGNGICEADDGEDCLSCPEDCRGKQKGNLSKQYCCGDGDGTNPVSCGDSRCTSDLFECTDIPSAPYCCGDNSCTGEEDGNNCELDCGPAPFCGDATCDIGEDSCSCAADCGVPPAVETSLCTDTVDNDCDLAVDCDDSDCSSDPSCAPPACDNDGTCDIGEDCNNCSNDCAGVAKKKPSNRYCCGDGTPQSAEGDGTICDGNY